MMAKKKTEKESPFVPVEEQPYRVPENWCWVILGKITDVVSGGTPSTSVKEYYENGTIPWISPADLSDYTEIYISHGRKSITQLGLEKSSARLLPTDTVCLSSRAPIGYVAIAQNPLATNQGFKSFTPSDSYLPHYLYWYLKGIKEELEAKASGTTFLELSGSKAAQLEFPLAPLSEQQRIVDRIESLFAKLDEAKEKAQEALESFGTRKSATLHEAFSGELTRNWRKEHGIKLESWKRMRVSELCHSLKYGTAKKSQAEGEMAVIRMGNLQHGEIDWSDLVYSSDREDIEKYQLSPGDVLFNRTNSSALVGKTSIYRGNIPAIYAGYLIKLDYDHSLIMGDYLNYALNTVDAKEYCNLVKTDGVNQSNINARKIGEYSLKVPLLSEQSEIVRILDDFFTKEAEAREKVESTLDAIENIKKSILAKAFRGELGTNNPEDESAEELLKRTLA